VEEIAIIGDEEDLAVNLDLAGQQPGGLPLNQQHQEIDEDQAGEDPPDPQAAAMARNLPTGSQIALLSSFDGEATSDIEMWIASVTRCVDQFNWNNDAAIAAVIKNKLTGKAAFWLETQRRKRIMLEGYADVAANEEDNIVAVTGLKTALINRFKVSIQALQATAAITDLKMRPSERCQDFFDRVEWSMEVKNHTYTDVEKAADAYIRARDSDVFLFFSAGLPASIREAAMVSPVPTDALNLLKRCIQIELNHSGAKKLIASLAGQQGIGSPGNGTDMEGMVKEIAALRAQLKCYNCQGNGHFARECTKPKKEQAHGQASATGASKKKKWGNKKKSRPQAAVQATAQPQLPPPLPPTPHPSAPPSVRADGAMVHHIPQQHHMQHAQYQTYELEHEFLQPQGN
jgi:hypothetical protein